MPSVSEEQRKTMAWALAYKEGRRLNVPSKIKSIADRMSVETLRHYVGPVKEKINIQTPNKQAMEKNATTISATKNLLRHLKKNNVSVKRDVKPKGFLNRLLSPPQEPKAHFQPKVDQPNMFTKPKIEAKGGEIYVPKGYKGHKYLDPKKVGPREVLFHEGGHFIDFNKVKNHDEYFDRALRYGTRTKSTLKDEQSANNEAIHFMSKHNVPSDNIDQYKKRTNPLFDTYRKAVKRHADTRNFWSPIIPKGIKDNLKKNQINPHSKLTVGDIINDLPKDTKEITNYPNFDPKSEEVSTRERVETMYDNLVNKGRLGYKRLKRNVGKGINNVTGFFSKFKG